MHGARAVILLFLLLASMPGQRLPVLRQIELPHNYYYREMYLPQLTTGPSSVAWVPQAGDSQRAQEVIYSMQGWLWRQALNSATATQITGGAGYDYQPDVSPDGKWAIFAKYDGDAMQLWSLSLTTGKAQAVTKGGAVNLEPRFSPDGKRVAYVSTEFNNRFHIFVAQFDAAAGTLKNPQRLTGENRSQLPRYYYSPYDHEISPTWSPDGKEIIYISNRGHIHGTGGFWRMTSQPPAVPAQPAVVPRGPFARLYAQTPTGQDPGQEIRYEETTWRAKPDWSHDGKRVIYSSYLGRSWNQLWVMTDRGGDVFPLTYGEFDNTAPRWSPNDKQVAFISNRDGNTSLWVLDAHSGEQEQVVAASLKYMQPMATVEIRVLDALRQPTPARISVTGADGRAYAPRESWMAADDSFVRKERQFEAHYFASSGIASVTVPVGKVSIDAMRGIDYEPAHLELEAKAGQPQTVVMRLRPLAFAPETGRWVSGDVHVHMNYAGSYRATPRSLLAQMQSENLNVVQELIVNKEQRFPDIEYAERLGKIDPVSKADFQILPGQEFHTSYWGHLGLLNINHLVIPGYAGYPNTPAASIFPTNAAVADMAHAQNKDVLVGYVHPFDGMPDPGKDPTLTDELPVDVALGKVNYYEVVGFSDHKDSAAVWYKLLNLGYRIPAAAGTDAMTDYASLRGPAGLDRVYIELPPGRWTMAQWLAGLKAGKTFATNGPLLRFSLGGQPIGGELKLAAAKQVKFTAALRSIVPVDHFELVCNGEVAMKLPLPEKHTAADVTGGFTLARSGWCVLRAWAEKSESPVFDIYPYASTSPIYVSVGGKPPSSPEDARFFIAWIDRLMANAQSHTGYNTPAEKLEVMKTLTDAKAVFERQAK